MTLKQAVEQRIEQLKGLLNKASYAYYVVSAPIMEDATYDGLYRELEGLEQQYPHLISPDSPTQRIGESPVLGFTATQHSIALYSLDNIFNLEELKTWENRWRKLINPVEPVFYVGELKIDGSAIALTYINGVLEKGVTRGDGITGEDITQNIKTIHSIPLKLNWGRPPEKVEIRGEAFLPRSEFIRINQERDQKFANPRNAVSGTLRQLDSKIVAQRHLSFFAYTLHTQDQPQSQWQCLHLLEQIGFLVNPHRVLASSLTEIKSYYQQWQSQRNNLDYLTDGVVVKLDSVTLQESLGFTQKSPRWSVALKYPAQEASTLVKDIIVNVGRTGVVTPMALVEPVHLAGTIVQRATLHNQARIKELDIRIGDTVVIRKAGEIIPEIVNVLLNLRPPEGIDSYSMPTQCPQCGSLLYKSQADAAIRCLNSACPAIIKGQILHWASRDALDISGLGEKIIEALLKAKLINSVADLYKMEVQQVVELERMGKKSAEKLIQAINGSKGQPWYRILYGLGIGRIGKANAKLLSQHFSSSQQMTQAGLDQFEAIHGIGTEVAHTLITWFKNPGNQELLRQLHDSGLNTENPTIDSGHIGGLFSGKTFVLTGTLPTLSREQAKVFIENHGGRVVDSISSKTDYLLVGENPGSKLVKAHNLGIAILNQGELLQMAEG